MKRLKAWRLVIAFLSMPIAALAQAARDSAAVPNSELFHRSDLYVAAGFAGATIAMFPLDRHLASEVRREDYLGSEDLRRAATIFRFLGGQAPAIIGISAYALGRVSRLPAMAEVGLHTTEALLVATGITTVLKGAIGRERPYVSDDTNPHRFRAFQGWTNSRLQSFPSGHTTAAFSMAAALTAEVHEKWPGRTRIIGPILYTLAAGVGLSRMYEDKHWASDVAMGAAIGTFGGLKTVRFNHTHAGNRLDRTLLGNARWTVLPHGAGLSLIYKASP